ncbi:hypothetical protein [Paenibacillus cymbidii]|uniref:hypothetical protein n=1 Tax=Paenibacillus cymbidii TaxID=1639034 RepID=UPI0010809308|nr:hypothetical protein [Paenibacillus cymbidii]
MSKLKSSDVKHSIAGFYYQLMLACKELITLLNNFQSDKSYVAVEFGADVRIFDAFDIRMEAKFYNSNVFTRYKEAITHSIYNFYNTFKKDPTVKYRFKCNVPIHPDDADLFNKWNKSSETIKYIRECFIYESVDKEPISTNIYKQFKDDYIKKNPHLKKPQYKQALLQHLALHPDPTEFQKYLFPELICDDAELELFLSTIEFDFPLKKSAKYESISRLNETIKHELLKFDNSLNEQDVAKIKLLILEGFLNTTVDPKIRTLTVKACKEIIQDQENAKLKYFEQIEYQDIIKEIEEELFDYEYVLAAEGHSKYLDDIMSLIICLKEELYSEIDEYGVKEVLGRFVMSHRSHPLETIKLFEALSEMIVKNDLQHLKVSIKDIEGFNNISIGEATSVSMRTLPAARSANKGFYLILNNFIDHTRENHQISKASGGETVVFDTDINVCEFEAEAIDNLIIDICKIRSNIQFQEMYKSFKYKCSKCMKLSYIGKCPFIQEVRESHGLGTDCEITRVK